MSASQTVRFNITAKVQNGNTVYEAVARIPGFRPAAVEKIEDGCTQFRTRSAITAVCNNRAVSLGMKPAIQYAGETTVTTTNTKATRAAATQTTPRSRAKTRKSKTTSTTTK